MYGGSYGSVDREENFMDDDGGKLKQNQGVIVLNPDAFQSPLLQDYAEVENTDIFEVIESLKDPEFLYKHA